jgi:YD repeat-containing protein
MMKNLIFPFFLILVFVACSKSEDNSTTSVVKPLPTSVITIDTTGGTVDTFHIYFAYDTLSRLAKVTDDNGFYTYNYASNGNLLKRSRFSADSVMQEYRVFYYSLDEIIKIEDYNSVSKKSMLVSKRKSCSTTANTNGTGEFTLQNWYAFSYLTGTSLIDSIYSANSTNTINYYQLITYDSKGNIASSLIKGNNNSTIVNLSSSSYTYDTKNNVFKNYPNSTDLLIDSIGSIGSNNVLKTDKIVYASDGSGNSTEIQYEITYNSYGYPTEIKGGGMVQTITYDTDKTTTATTKKK